VHQSVKDYLLKELGQIISSFGYLGVHEEAAIRCLDWLTSNLRINICELGDPGIEVDEVNIERKDACPGPALRYALRDHLRFSVWSIILTKCPHLLGCIKNPTLIIDGENMIASKTPPQSDTVFIRIATSNVVDKRE